MLCVDDDGERPAKVSEQLTAYFIETGVFITDAVCDLCQ